MLVGIEPLKQIVELTLQAQFIKPYLPTNLLLIAKPETAKTSILSISQKKDYVYYVNEITAKRLIDDVFPLIERKEIKVIVIPDLLNCIEKQKSTRQQFLMMVKSLIEEGFTQISTYHKRFKAKKPLKCSMITAITVVDFKKYRRYLEHTGILSRFIPFSFDYPIAKIKQILEFIESEEEIEDIKFKTIKKNTKVKGSKDLFRNFEMISTKLGIQYSGYGFRTQKRLQQLSKASAILRGDDKVIQEDINKIIYLANWINFDFNTM